VRDVLESLSQKLFSKAIDKGLDELEFYGRWSRVLEITVSRHRIKSVSSSYRIEYGVFGSIGKRYGSIGSEDLDADPDKLLDQLVSIIKASREDPAWKGFAKNYGKGFEAKSFDKKIAELEPDNAVDVVVEANDTAREAGLRNGAEETIVSECMYIAVTGGVYIANSNNEKQYGEYTYHMMFSEVKSRKAGEESSFSSSIINRRLDLDEVRRESARAGEFSVKFIGAKPVESGEYKVLLDPYMTALFMEVTLDPAFSALNVQENRSPLKNKIGSVVLNENIDVWDDPTIDWGIGSRPFDDEGLATSRKPLIEKGVLKNLLYNHYTAVRENKSSTGNGFRANPSSPTTPSSTNLLVMGKRNLMSMDEMISEIDRGIIVHGMIGYWMSNFVNGSTQATVSHGLYVEKGDVKRAVKGVVIGGNIYEWLGGSLIGVGKDIVKMGRIYSPAILVEKVRVAG